MPSKPEKMPKGLQVVHQDGTLQLIYQHHRGAGFFLVLASLFWTVMLVPCYQVLSRDGSFGIREFVAFLPFLVTAVGFGYVGLAKMLNKSEVLLSAQTLRVHHHPIPWFGQVELAAQKVKGFQVRRDMKPLDARHRVTLALVADLADGDQLPLLRAISDAKAASRMHQEAQTYLEEMRRGDTL